MPKEIWHLSPSFHLLSFSLFFCLTTSPFLTFFFPLLAVLCHCCNYFLPREAVTKCLFCTEKGLFSQGDRESPQSSLILAFATPSSSLIFRSDVFICRLHDAPFVDVCEFCLFFSLDFGHSSLSILPLQWQGTFTERYNPNNTDSRYEYGYK